MFSDKRSSSKILGATSASQELRIKLEWVEQENRIIVLEKMEYAKEINELKQQNQKLMEDNNKYFESAKLEKQEMSFLRAVSVNITHINLKNDDLNERISEYQDLAKRLKSENKNLQKENKKYRVIMEKLSDQKQKREETQRNSIINLEHKIKELQNECDALRTEINTLHSIQLQSSLNSLSEIKSFEPPPPKYSETMVFRIKKTSSNHDLGLYALDNISYTYSEQSESAMPISLIMNNGMKSSMNELHELHALHEADQNDLDHEDIIHQLSDLGYDGNDIIWAMQNTVNDKYDIDEIIKVIDHKIEIEECHIELVECYIECEAKMEEIQRLNSMNDEHQTKLKRLQRKNNLLRQQNNTLRENKSTQTNSSCIGWFR